MAPLVPAAIGQAMQGPPAGIPLSSITQSLPFADGNIPTATATAIPMADGSPVQGREGQHHGGPIAVSSATVSLPAEKRAESTSSAKATHSSKATATATGSQSASTTDASSSGSGGSDSDSSDASSNSTSTSSAAAGSDTYKLYKGDGSSSAGWPAVSSWVSSFDSMWSANLPLIKKACPSGVPANSDTENDELKAAIQSAASGSKLDPRFVLAAVMQESKGCVRVPSTKYSVVNPGVLQDHSGKNTCNPAISPASNPKQDCTKADIQGMVNDGVFGSKAPGTATGDGYEQVFAQAGNTAKNDEAQQYYIAARLYNSGSEVANRLECGVATHCYSSDIANRLTGWVNAPTKCQEASISAGCPSS